MKTCIHCQQSKPLDAFRKSARMIGGRENGCKDCHNERRREGKPVENDRSTVHVHAHHR